ncbi:MAG: hypothetical protein JWR21_3953 [Herminiimonas sp.]|nr:hypothetical protein [Herminiimonas sp.]MDB5853137.1 hypothetical protein [Herminiimonas sp.]
MSAFIIDAFQFCRQQERREGKVAVSDLRRLSEELSGVPTGLLHWSLVGGSDRQGRPQLQVSATGLVQLRCQRCLGPMPFDLASHSVLVLAPDEATADELDQLLEEEEVEVVVGSSAMNFLTIVEDEALLALPLAPRHDHCPEPLEPVSDKPGEEARKSPFAALKNLKN